MSSGERPAIPTRPCCDRCGPRQFCDVCERHGQRETPGWSERTATDQGQDFHGTKAHPRPPDQRDRLPMRRPAPGCRRSTWCSAPCQHLYVRSARDARAGESPACPPSSGGWRRRRRPGCRRSTRSCRLFPARQRSGATLTAASNPENNIHELLRTQTESKGPHAGVAQEPARRRRPLRAESQTRRRSGAGAVPAPSRSLGLRDLRSPSRSDSNPRTRRGRGEPATSSRTPRP